MFLKNSSGVSSSLFRGVPTSAQRLVQGDAGLQLHQPQLHLLVLCLKQRTLAFERAQQVVCAGLVAVLRELEGALGLLQFLVLPVALLLQRRGQPGFGGSDVGPAQAAAPSACPTFGQLNPALRVYAQKRRAIR